MDEEIKKAFEGLTKIYFHLSDKNIYFYWADGEHRDGQEKGIPAKEIYIGTNNPYRLWHTLCAYDIERIEYTKPGPLKNGILTVIGVDGEVIEEFPFRDSSNMEKADKFNQCLALYKKFDLGKG